MHSKLYPGDGIIDLSLTSSPLAVLIKAYSANAEFTKDEEYFLFSTKIHIVLVLYLWTSWSVETRSRDLKYV